ncbi:MAG: prolyl oligopeptidase family serine peptidase [Acidobacteriaceae bacterium]
MRIPLSLVVVCGLVAPVVGLGLGVAQGVGTQGSAQTSGARRPMTFKDLMAMKRVSDPQVSASGKWVLFSVTDVSLEKNTKVNHLWVVPLDGSAPARQVTSNSGESFGRFAPDGQVVSYTGAPTKDDPFVRWSPMMFIKNAKTPTLVVHSQRDYRLDVSQGYQLFTALQVLGVPSEMLYYPDESHFVQKPQNSELWNKTVSEWCDRWVGKGEGPGSRVQGPGGVEERGSRVQGPGSRGGEERGSRAQGPGSRGGER